MMAFRRRTSMKSFILTIFLALFFTHALVLIHAASGGVMGGSSFSSNDDKDRSRHDSFSRFSSSDYYYRSSGDATPMSSGDSGGGFVYSLVVVFLFVVAVFACEGHRLKGDNILMVQVALWSEARPLGQDLDQVAYIADTATVKGLHYILTESCLALLRYHNQCISAFSRVEQKSDIMNLEKRFNELSLEERAKFDIETLVNINNTKVKRNIIRKPNKPGKEFIVVTILVAARGRHELPDIKNGDNLKLALQSLASIETKSVKAVQVLWTPQNENDALFEEELLENYPLLRSISDSESDPY